MTAPKTPRRRSLLKGAAVAAGAMSAPMVAVAQTTSFRFQSTWPAKDIFHEYANDFASKVNAMAGGRLKIEVLPSGAVVPAFQLLEAVNKGTLDGGHGVVAGTRDALARRQLLLRLHQIALALADVLYGPVVHVGRGHAVQAHVVSPRFS